MRPDMINVMVNEFQAEVIYGLLRDEHHRRYDIYAGDRDDGSVDRGLVEEERRELRQVERIRKRLLLLMREQHARGYWGDPGGDEG